MYIENDWSMRGDGLNDTLLKIVTFQWFLFTLLHRKLYKVAVSISIVMKNFPLNCYRFEENRLKCFEI